MSIEASKSSDIVLAIWDIYVHKAVCMLRKALRRL